MESNEIFTIYEGMFSIDNASKYKLSKGLSECIKISEEQAKYLIESLEYIKDIRRIFKRYSNVQEDNSHNPYDVNRLLDDLCDKEIIEIRTEKIRVQSNIKVLRYTF